LPTTVGLSGREREFDLICCIGGLQRCEDDPYPAKVWTLCICMGFNPAMPDPRRDPAAATTRCCISRKRGYTDYRHRLGLYLNLLSTSWSLSYFGLARKTKLISVAAAASLAFWHRFTCRHLLQITRSLRNCQVLIIPSEKREKITSLPPSCQHRHLSSAPPLPFVQCI